jgi:O-antigen/teichoic acid export membrane protein
MEPQFSREAADAGQIKISGGLIARNTLLNLIGLAAPLLVAILTIPYVVHGLGTDRFGLLSLAWVVLGYFTIFDLGLGRATTKYVG